MSNVNQDAIDAIELALNTLGCSQKDLALQLNVSPTQISKWKNLFRELAEIADESGETGYDTYPLKDEMDLLSWSTIRVLSDMGVAPPTNFPKELIDEEGDVDWELVDENPYTNLVYKIYKSLTDVYGFYIAYVDELISDNDELLNTDADNIEPCLIELAASKVEGIDEKFAPKFGEFRYKVRKECKRGKSRGGQGDWALARMMSGRRWMA